MQVRNFAEFVEFLTEMADESVEIGPHGYYDDAHGHAGISEAEAAWALTELLKSLGLDDCLEKIRKKDRDFAEALNALND